MNLFTLVQLLGVVLLLAGVGLAIWKWGFSGEVGNKPVPFTWVTGALGVGVFCTLINSFIYYQPAGFSALIQYVNGTQNCHTEAGPHLKWFGDVIEMKQVMTIPIKQPVRFNDAVTADATVVARFSLSSDTSKTYDETTEKWVHGNLCKTILQFRSEKNLRQAALVPATQSVIRNSARLLSAQEFVAGKGGEFENAILEQLQEGLLVLDIKEKIVLKKVPVVHVKGDEKRETSANEKVVQYEVRTKVDPKTGLAQRKQHSLTQYGILVTQAEVSNVVPSDAFKAKLKKQMDESAKAAVNREAAKAAEFDKQRIIAEGDRDKASKRIEEEKKQITTLIAAETLRKENNEKYLAEVIALKTARLTAQKITALADANAYEKKKVMLADGALTLKLDAFKYAVDKTAAALSNKQLVPSIYFAGGSGDKNGMPNGAALIQLMTAKYAQDLGVGKINAPALK